MMRWILAARLLFALLLACGTLAQARAAEELCPLTSSSREWSAACFENVHGARQIKKQYRKNVVFDKHGYAVVITPTPAELIVVNRQGKVVPAKEARLTGFHFEPGDQAGGVARFGYLVAHPKTKGEFKCGYYRARRFRVLVPPVYDYCDDFTGDEAIVCVSCTNHCDSGDCHEPDLINGEALLINKKNEVLRTVQLPSLPLCSEASTQPENTAQCRPRPPNPASSQK